MSDAGTPAGSDGSHGVKQLLRLLFSVCESYSHGLTVGTKWSCIAGFLSVSPKDIHSVTVSPLLQLPDWKTYFLQS